MNMKRHALAAVAVAVLACSAWAVEIHVPGDYPTIQEAIDASSSGDVVMIFTSGRSWSAAPACPA
jgi:hypothetical protein